MMRCVIPMSPRTLADATGDHAAAGFLTPDQAQQEIRSPWRSAGVAVAMLLAIVLFITLIGVTSHG